MKRALSVLAFALFACAANFANAATTRIFITSGTSFTIPADWNSQDNSIEIIGAGGFGNDCSGITSIGGGGGAYSKISNFVASPGANINLNFTANVGATRGFAWFSTSTTVLAEYGGDANGATGCSANGGRAANGFGTVKFDGGSGGIGSGGGTGTGAGGGAAGPNGAGAAPSGINATTGGAADAGFGGAGGIGGLAPGGNGTEFDASHGAGGGGGTDASGNGGPGGNYGGGGGYQAFGSGALIVITYTTRVRVSSGVF